MQCEQAGEYVINPVPKSERAALDAHLAQCDSCRALHEAQELISDAAASWVDEPAPPLGGVAMFPHRRTLSLGPILAVAACMLMASLVLFRMEIRSDDQGVTLSFGSQVDQRVIHEAVQLALADRQQSDEALKAHLNEAIVAGQNQTALQMQTALNRYQRDQNTYFKGLMVEYAQRNTDERNEELTKLVAGWNSLRKEDLATVESQMKTLLSRQNQTAGNLYQLAGYVNRSSRSNP